MSREPSFNSEWPEGRLDRRVEATFVDGAWAGLAAAAVGFVVHVVAAQGGEPGVADTADVMVRGLAAAAVGVGLGPLFAWVTGRVRVPHVVGGLLLGVLLAAVAWPLTTIGALPIVLYGATLGLVLRYLRARRALGESPTEPTG